VTVATRGLRVVTRPGEGAGFRLAGVPVDEVGPGEEAARFRALAADPTLAVIAIETRVIEGVPDALLRQASARALPVVLPFTLPRASGAGAGQAYVAALIRRAIGYHVKLEERR
jgi:V/A-type H+-transporting ATPase subunit F